MTNPSQKKTTGWTSFPEKNVVEYMTFWRLLTAVNGTTTVGDRTMGIFMVMIAGMLLGRVHRLRKVKAWNERLSMLSTFVLIFCMGVLLGRKENFLQELTTLGLQSFLFFAIPTTLSVVLVYLLTRRFLKGR